MRTGAAMGKQKKDSSNREPELKYRCEDLCEAYQEGIDVWDGRVRGLLIGSGKDLKAAEGLRASFQKGFEMLVKTFMEYYSQAGAHFAIGDAEGEAEKELALCLHYLNTKVIDVLQQAPDDAIAGVPWVLGSFQDRYKIVRYDFLQRHADYVCYKCVNALHRLFTKISAWAVAIHTLPPLASQPTTPSPSASYHEAESFFERIGAPFHRQRYEYKQLPTPYSFRLVRILTPRPYVTCEIKIFHLSDPPSFKALSYCWGKYGQHSSIWCKDQLFKVSSNLRKGLQRLHRYSAWSKVEWFWIDQICINQSDLEERMQQVRLMRAIYQRAQNTVIWLGSDDVNASSAISIIGDIYSFAFKKEQETAARFEAGSPADVQITLPAENDPRWASLSTFLDLPWFERCWIIQEVVVSPGDPIILCGESQLLWSRFQEAMAALTHYHPAFRAERMKLMNGIFDLLGNSDAWELSSLLQSTRPFQATDPRDKIFALLGLAGESRSPDKWPKALMPDYNRATKDVYTAVTRYCIEKTKTLTILSQAGDVAGRNIDTAGTDYPSWVPLWYEMQRTCGPLSAFTVTQSNAGWKMLVEKFNAASGDTHVSYDPNTPPDVLRLEGIQLTTVDSCLPATSAPRSSPAISQVSTRIPDLLSMCRARLLHLSNVSFLRTFLLVTTAGLIPEHYDARHEPLTHFRAFLHAAIPRTPETEGDGEDVYTLRRAFRSNLGISTLAPNLTPPLVRGTSSSSGYAGAAAPPTQLQPTTHEAQAEAEPHPADPARYTSSLTPLLNRRLFTTATGHLGLGPETMMSGDVVAVLFGGRTPFVVRRMGEGGCWRVVGECYVEGFMRGEALGGGVGDGGEWFDLV